jgi:hypothetical protein
MELSLEKDFIVLVTYSEILLSASSSSTVQGVIGN